jgi:hypothetical protein
MLIPTRDLQQMSDGELLAAQAAWERDRATLWARVATLTGASYTAAYDDYMAVKARANAVIIEVRRRGIRRRRATAAATTGPTPDPDFKFKVSTTATSITAVADGAVRYPDTARSALRDGIRTAVAELHIGPEEVLRGTFAGALPPNSKTDVENRVLLNMSLSERCLRRGFAFEHNRRPPHEWSCGYDYRAVAAEDPFDLWRPGKVLARWDGVALDHGLTAPAIWWALRTNREARSDGPAEAVPDTLLRITVTSPRPLSLVQIKAVADCTVAAAQWTRAVDPAGLTCFTAKLASAGIQAPRDVVEALLRDRASASAGHCNDGLIAKDGRVDPDDHLVVAGIVRTVTGRDPNIQITAAINDATRCWVTCVSRRAARW